MKRYNILDHFVHTNTGYIHAHGEAGTEALISEMELTGNEKVLEVGIGTGTTVAKLAGRYPHLKLHGVDTSHKMLDRAWQRLHTCGVQTHCKLELSHLNEQHWSLADNSIDLVYTESVLAILSIKDLQRTVQEVLRVLRPDGRLLLNETIWLDETPLDLIHEINYKCLETFGIIQSSNELPYTADWQACFVDLGLIPVRAHPLSRSIPAVLPAVNLIDKKSRVFTIKGKLKGAFNIYMRYRQYVNLNKMKDIMPMNRQLMRGMLLVFKKPG